MKKEEIIGKGIKYRKKLRDKFMVGVVLGLHRLLIFYEHILVKNINLQNIK